MSTLVPPRRLGSSSANAVIDMKSSNVFLSTRSPVVILWGTSFQHSGLLSSVLWECENTREATHTTAFPWAGNPGPEGGSSGEGQWERELAAVIGPAFPSPIILVSRSPSHSYSGFPPLCILPRPASFARCISLSSLDFHLDLLSVIELLQKNWIC